MPTVTIDRRSARASACFIASRADRGAAPAGFKLSLYSALAVVAAAVASLAASTQSAEAAWVNCASETNRCTNLAKDTVVRFRSTTDNKKFIEKKVTGSITCDRPEFGGDPHPYAKKECVRWQAARVDCAAESNICRVIGSKNASVNVIFAASVAEFRQGKHIMKRIQGGESIVCARKEFGGDPAPYKKKYCFYYTSPELNG